MPPPELFPRFPLYVVSKGRSEYLLTSRHLTAMGVTHNLVVEPQEVEVYQRSVAAAGVVARVLPLDLTYKDRYELCDDLGLTRSTGPGPARNFAWDHSIAEGHEWHWVMDDNLNGFFRLNRGLRVPAKTPAFWRAMEDFVLRYQNVAMAGPNYYALTPIMLRGSPRRLPPFITNTRIYSCNLIRNDLRYRWRGRYNEDTILSLDMLKDGWCTVTFYAFLQAKLATQVMKGGNTQEFYHREGTLEPGKAYAKGGTTAKSEMMVRVHPDCSRVVWRFGRVHHLVDYARFTQQLVRKPGVEVSPTPNEYGMRLVQRME